MEPVAKTQKLLLLLAAAGTKGLPSTTLALEIGHRFPARLHDLKKAGYEIRAEKRSGGVWFYSLLNTRLDHDPAVSNALQRFQRYADPVSVRRAWQFLSNALRDGDALARARVIDLLARQPELRTNRSVRHNLGARKTALLDQLAVEAGIV
jgi:hypothetical protein